MSDQLLIDMAVDGALKAQSTREYAHSDLRLATVWTSNARFEASSIYGIDPAAQLEKSRKLIAQGYRPVSLSMSQTTTEGPLVTASVWHRPRFRRRSRIDLPSVKHGPQLPWSGWGTPRKSGPYCGTVPIPGCGASSSTG